jgi:hypothetical protein
MTLSDLAAIGSFVSGVAVLISLVFLYYQLRQVSAQVGQSERSQRALVQQGRVARSSDQLFRLAAPDLTSAYLKGTAGDASTSEEEYFRFFLVLTAVARSAEDVFFQHELGLLDAASLANQLSSVRAVFTAPEEKRPGAACDKVTIRHLSSGWTRSSLQSHWPDRIRRLRTGKRSWRSPLNATTSKRPRTGSSNDTFRRIHRQPCQRRGCSDLADLSVAANPAGGAQSGGDVRQSNRVLAN